MRTLEEIMKEFEVKLTSNEGLSEEEQHQLSEYIMEMARYSTSSFAKRYGGDSFQLMMSAIFNTNKAVRYYKAGTYDLLDYICFYIDEAMKSIALRNRNKLPVIEDKLTRRIVMELLPVEQRILSYYFTGHTDVEEIADMMKVDAAICADALEQALNEYTYACEELAKSEKTNTIA